MVARQLRATWLACAALCWALPSAAQVVQTDAVMTPLPQPLVVSMSSDTEWGLVGYSWGHNPMTGSNRDVMGNNANPPILYGDYYSPANGLPQFEDGDAITLQGLFKWRREMLDPVKDAKTGPGYFSPACGFSGQLLLMGGNCKVAFGWYNVTDPNSTTPPAPEEIYEFIPNDPTYLNCKDENGGPKTDGFCPLAWDTRSPRDLSVQQWTPKAFDSGNIKTDPNYKGGYVGFALIGNPALSCKQNKFSMYAHNQKNAQGVPWVTTLIYQSTADPEGFYMAFEDLPMAADDWHQTGVNGSNARNDGDFNDFVFYVSGINCAGGGMPCTVPGVQGACTVGRTDCAAEGQMGTCRPIIAPAAELCDNVDNDCNGVVDEGMGLCPGTQVCDKGKCIEACGTGEFRCPMDFTCKSGSCIDNACVDVVCDPGQVCRKGVCAGACENVVCPSGEECQLGRCVDPCAAVECSAGKVCERGLCVSDCSCRGCKDGLVCGTDGKCADPACANVMCEAGKKCAAGACVDACEGVVCPNEQVCVNGSCTPRDGTGGSSAGGTDGGIIIGGSLNFGGNNGTGANGSGNGNKPTIKDPGCACDVVGRSPAGGAALLLGGAAVVLLGARRRRQAA